MAAEMAENSKIPRVEILMSTYNGEQYLREQLDSLIAQDYGNLSVLVRDDGSVDGTGAILQEYESRMNLRWYSGINIGLAPSFFDLVKNSSPEASYFAFCDQDDVWMANKVSVAVNSLRGWEDPALPCVYGCRSVIVDQNLKTMGMNRAHGADLRPSFGNAIAQCILQGCSTVINFAMRQEIILHTPSYAITHDWWIYLAATGIGKIFIDQTSYLLYRQHEGNVLGRRSIGGKWKKYLMLYRIYGKDHALLTQMREFSRFYHARLSDGDRELLDCYVHFRDNMLTRLRLVFNRRIGRLRFTDDMLWRAVCLFDLL